MYAAFASISMDAMDAVALNRDEDCMLLRRGQDTLVRELKFHEKEVQSAVLGSRAARLLWYVHAFSIHTPLIPQVPLRHRFCGARTAVYGVYVL